VLPGIALNSLKLISVVVSVVVVVEIVEVVVDGRTEVVVVVFGLQEVVVVVGLTVVVVLEHVVVVVVFRANDVSMENVIAHNINNNWQIMTFNFILISLHVYHYPARKHSPAGGKFN
jgi:hypothetical protein